jgi:DNA (cytosine-5)-methyltransferase 1
MIEGFKPTYKWFLSDLKKIKKNDLKVFSCFACGGGSTMGYKLAGMNVLGANEIDPEMAWHYKTNHNPKHYYLEDIRVFRKRKDLPEELYNLDILDGSPPCSSFSMAGNREKDWGKKKVFREGQSSQVLDDLFFEYIELARVLQPKIVIAENVKGMLQGNAKGYVKQIIRLFNLANYDVQLFLLNAATMGVPQKRERVFFICKRKDLNLPNLKLNFKENTINVKSAIQDIINEKGIDKSFSTTKKYWEKCKPGKSFSSVHPKGSLFNWYKIGLNNVFPTIAASNTEMFMRWDRMETFSTNHLKRFNSYPMDYVGKSDSSVRYMIGMSVPPLMIYKIAEQIKKQWFNL